MAALFSLFVSKKKIIKLFTGFIDKTIKNENEINSALERLYFDLPEAIFRMGSVRDYNYFISSSQKKEQDALIAGLGTLPRLDSNAVLFTPVLSIIIIPLFKISVIPVNLIIMNTSLFPGCSVRNLLPFFPVYWKIPGWFNTES